MRLATWLVAAVSMTAMACIKIVPVKPVTPLGPQAFRFIGGVPNQDKFDPYAIPQCRKAEPEKPIFLPPRDGKQSEPPIEHGQPVDPPVNVLVLLVDTADLRFTGTAADLTAYRGARLADYQTNTNSHWREASYDNVSVNLTMPDRLFHLSGTFDDYFNRGYVAASLVTKPITFPLVLDGTESAVIEVHDAHDRTVDVAFDASATYNDMAALVTACQAAFAGAPAVPSPWVTCSDGGGGRLRLELTTLEVNEGAYLRPKRGTHRDLLGVDGPLEAPGEDAIGATAAGPATLTGTTLTFPLTLTTAASVQLEVRNKDLRTRRYTVPVPAATYNTPQDVVNLMLPVMNAELAWIESGGAADAISLRVVAAQSGKRAAVRVVGGTGLASLGLAGPMRTDGVITFDGRDTVRDGGGAANQALSMFLQQRAAETGVPIDAAHEAQLGALVDADLRGITAANPTGFDVYMVLFVDQMTGVPGKRAGAGGGRFVPQVTGAGGYTFWRQIDARLMVGIGNEGWQTWAHEIGHVIGFWDLYVSAWHDAQFDRQWDYLHEWSLMNDHWQGNHSDSWHKLMLRWITSVADILEPGPGATVVSRFTITPLEYPFSEYAGVGTADFPARQLARVRLSPTHWVHLENRQPGLLHSQMLPDDVRGWSPASAGSNAGGLLVTDTVDPHSEVLYRPAVSVLNPNGSGTPPVGSGLQARGLRPGDALDLSTTFPAYSGIRVRVTGQVPGPPGRPEALQVEVERGPGDFLDLGLRPWNAPTEYATRDLWIDWPGNGAEDYSAIEPPVGNGDQTHWHPDGTVVNTIKVRVHNYGTVVGRGVVVRAYVNTPMGLGDRGQFVPLPDPAPQDVPAGGFTDFSFEWRPTQAGHTCLRAEILTHSSTLSELDVSNNSAQENITDFGPTAGSPYAPLTFEYKIRNDFDREIRVTVQPQGLAAGMDLELEDPSPTLAPQSERTFRGRIFVDRDVIPPAPREKRRCDYRFNLNAFLHTADYWLPFGGITVDVNPSYGSKLRLRGVKASKAASKDDPRGRQAIVTGELVGRYNAGQTVDVVIVDRDKRSYGGRGTTDGSGRFSIAVPGVPPGRAEVMLYYFGPDLTPSTAGPSRIELQ